MTPEQCCAMARDMITATSYCFLITLSEAGQIEARMMQHFAPDEKLVIWFGSSPKSRKVRMLQHHDQAVVAVGASTEPAYVTLYGSASIEEDISLRQRYWREDWLVFFPDGPAGANYVLIRFVPQRIEMINFAQNIAPAPFGLMPAVLVRVGESWQFGQE